jgi:DNA-binding NarL/FixJ family response regulator
MDERVAPLVARLAGAVRREDAAAVAPSSGGASSGDVGAYGGEAPRLEARIRREIDAALSRNDASADDPRRRLSVRELEICDLVASGLTSKEIGERLSIAKATVERHRHNARRKLGMPDREGSIASALGHKRGGLY